MCGDKCSCKPKVASKCGCATVTTVCKPKCSPCCKPCGSSCSPPVVYVSNPKLSTLYCSYLSGCKCGSCVSVWDSRDKCSSVSCVLDSEILSGSSKEQYIKRYNLDVVDYKCSCGSKSKSCKCKCF